MKSKGSKTVQKSSTSGSQSGGRYHVPDWALRKLVKNGRDYSYRHPTIKNANMKAANRTKEQQEEFDRNHQPHIIYTPMGGQNKR